MHAGTVSTCQSVLWQFIVASPLFNTPLSHFLFKEIPNILKVSPSSTQHTSFFYVANLVNSEIWFWKPFQFWHIIYKFCNNKNRDRNMGIILTYNWKRDLTAKRSNQPGRNSSKTLVWLDVGEQEQEKKIRKFWDHHLPRRKAECKSKFISCFLQNIHELYTVPSLPKAKNFFIILSPGDGL